MQYGLIKNDKWNFNIGTCILKNDSQISGLLTDFLRKFSDWKLLRTLTLIKIPTFFIRQYRV